jgi:outer membrane lipoprotein SlyB
VCGDCGVIASVTPVKKAGDAGWAGTLGGAAAGGLAGNQFGKGSGKTAMTVVGVLGGALAGREVEKQVTSSTVYQVVVNMEAGGQRTVTVSSAEGLAPGTRVHVNGNSVQAY